MVDADCRPVPLRISCRADCPLTVGFSQAGADAVEAAMRDIEAQECGEFEKLGCQISDPTCSMNDLDVHCVQNVCTQDTPKHDIPDCVICLETSLQWESESNPGVGVTDRSRVEPCAYYHRKRIDPRTGNEFDCETELVACSAITSTGAISTALADSDVQAVLNSPENPVRLGNVRQGEIFRIMIGMRLLELSDASCEGAPPDCVPVPAGVQRLRETLQQIDRALSGPMTACFGIENLEN
jgi:hypothetical protein